MGRLSKWRAQVTVNHPSETVMVRLHLSPPEGHKMNNEFEEKGYKLIDLNLGFEDLMVKTFEDYAKANNIQPTKINVSPDPLDIYMEYLASIVQRDYTTPIVEKETDLELIPTYCYSRKYFKGSILDTHIDRDACEISLSYCISGPEWEMNMGNNTIITKIGKAVIYKGCEIPHGRSKPSSGEVIQVFNHWVTSPEMKKQYTKQLENYEIR